MVNEFIIQLLKWYRNMQWGTILPMVQAVCNDYMNNFIKHNGKNT